MAPVSWRRQELRLPRKGHGGVRDEVGGRRKSGPRVDRAARFGQDAARFAWGTELTPDSRHLANIWQGTFPLQDDATDGFAGAAPVRSFPPNEIGAYDMVGNVWEWTADMFQHDAFAERSTALNAEGCCYNPTGPSVTADPRNPHSRDSRVQSAGV